MRPIRPGKRATRASGEVVGSDDTDGGTTEAQAWLGGGDEALNDSGNSAE